MITKNIEYCSSCRNPFRSKMDKEFIQHTTMCFACDHVFGESSNDTEDGEMLEVGGSNERT